MFFDVGSLIEVVFVHLLREELELYCSGRGKKNGCVFVLWAFVIENLNKGQYK